MKISLNTIREINQHYDMAPDPAPEGADVLVQRIGAQLGGVEETLPIGKKYDGAVIVRIVNCEDHPNADRLHICHVDDARVTPDVERTPEGFVRVVCGAPNVRADMLAVWLPPGATVPSSYDNDPFVLEARALRGVVSNGMLASPRELAIGDSHEGILEIDEDAEPGTMFAEQYGLQDDLVVDIENKMFTHRPDCFGWLGVAREIAGIQGQAFKSPSWYRPDAEMQPVQVEKLPLTIRNDIPELVPRFTALPMAQITVAPSPLWLQVELTKVGLRPINNIVDLTNYYMLLTAQPLHAYDYDKVRALDGGDRATIVVRKPHGGESLTLLNGKTIEPRAEAILIATESQAIGLGGVMGGGNTEVDDRTRNIILECASFDMYSIRKTSMSSGVFSDAVTRFNKGQSPLQNRAILAKIVDGVQKLAGGKVAGDFIDLNAVPAEVMERQSLYPDVTVAVSFINARLGLSLSADDIARLLTNVEFTIAIEGDALRVRAPFWRTDIEIAEDVIEEVGRLYGFDSLPLDLPERSILPAERNSLIELKSAIRSTLQAAGANEVLTYSFVHGKQLETMGQDKSVAYKLGNALSPELQYYRTSLTPSLLDKVAANMRAGYGQFALFELGKVHLRSDQDSTEVALPAEKHRLAWVYAADAKTAADRLGAAYYQARVYSNELLTRLGIASDGITYEPYMINNENNAVVAWTAPFEPKRSALVWYAADNQERLLLGVIGELRSGIRTAMKLPDYTAAIEFDVSAIQSAMRETGAASYRPLSKYPSVSQDISLRVPITVSYGDLYQTVKQTLSDESSAGLTITVEPLDIYRADNKSPVKHITLRIVVTAPDRTLTDAVVAAMLDRAAQTAHEKFGAERL